MRQRKRKRKWWLLGVPLFIVGAFFWSIFPPVPLRRMPGFLDRYQGRVTILQSERVYIGQIEGDGEPSFRMGRAVLYLVPAQAEDVVDALGDYAGDSNVFLEDFGAMADEIEIGAVNLNGKRQTMVLYTYGFEVSTLDAWLSNQFPGWAEMRFGKLRFLDNRWFEPPDNNYDAEKMKKLHPLMR
ncbi:MAG: hypothetical protein ABL962_01870 [Fimbriimonadaceae bacterium]